MHSSMQRIKRGVHEIKKQSIMNTTQKIKLFLVDDDALLLKSMELDFKEHTDYEIETYATGELCISQLSKNPRWRRSVFQEATILSTLGFGLG